MYDETQNEFTRHEPCPNCPSSDALARYSDGGAYCFACGYSERGSGQSTHTSRAPMIPLEGDFHRIPSRNLTEETCRKFNVRVNEGRIQFPYYDSSRQLVGYKHRGKEKDFRWQGKNPDNQLFGQQLWGKGKSIVITEGEFDALSVFQARKNWPVVSVPSGAQSAKKALAAQLNYLLNFEEIILMFDNDDAGISAAEECVSLFPPDRVFTAFIDGYKDASEAVSSKDYDAVTQAIWNKSTYTPKSIVDGRTLFDLVTTPLHGRDADYPYPALNTTTGGLRLGELVTITAGSGTGKSTLCGEIAVSLINQDQKVGYIALEESVKRTGLRLMTVAANKPLHLNNEIPNDSLRSAFDSTLGSGNVFLRDGFGSVDPDQLLNDIRFLVKAHEVQWIVLDHLSILLSGNESSDERKMIDIVMTKLRSFVEETGIGMILISHLRRNQGDKGHEDGAQVSLSQLRGSHSIAQLSDLVIALERDISKGDNRAQLRVLKNRFNGQTGPAGGLSYSTETGRMTEALDFDTDDKPATPTDYGDF